MAKRVDDDFGTIDYIFRQWDAFYEKQNLVGVPIEPYQKKPALRAWQKLASNSLEQRALLRERYADHHIGVLAGTPLSSGRLFCFLDVDCAGLVPFVKAVVAPFLSGKRGNKGETIFAQAESGLKSVKLKPKGFKSPLLEIFASTGQTVIPPSGHPSGNRYEWVGTPLFEAELTTLPILTQERLAILSAVARNAHAIAMAEGGPTIKAHEHMLSLTSSGIALLTDDLEALAGSLNTLFHPDYAGNTQSETLAMLRSAKEKGLGALARPAFKYDPGDQGPIPLGYAGGEFIFRNQQTKEVVRRSSVQLMMAAGLLELASKSFWQFAFPKFNRDGIPIGIDWLAACDALIQACRNVGAIEVANIRGIGLWLDEGRLLLNLGGEEIKSRKFIYTTPKRLELIRGDVPVDLILEFLSKPDWETPSAAQLLLGWAFASVCCGALAWRPHAGLTGAAQSGKSTVLRGLGLILSPLALIKEGISTEAGIRQSIGCDARPVILDELEPESSRDRSRVERIVKLMRSSSSAVGSVARGTPEGKALNFSTSAMFLIAAINLYRISAADTSRLVKFSLSRHVDHQKRRNSADILALLGRLDSVGPAFCGMALDHAHDLLHSIPLIHSELPVVQERQADNMATLLAGYWVALNRRSICAPEVVGFVEPFIDAVEEQREGVELDDATECLNVLLGTSVFVTQEDTNDEGASFTHKETMPLGQVIAQVLGGNCTIGQLVAALDQHGIRIEGEGFLVANSHPGLDRIFRNSRWEGKLWGSAMSRLDQAVRMPQRRFSDGVRSLATWIPRQYLPESAQDPEDRS